MKMQSSYIFLKNEYNNDLQKKKSYIDGNNIVLELGNSVISFIRKCYTDLELDEKSVHFFKKKYLLNIEREKSTFKVAFFLHHVVGITYLDICVEGERKAQIIDCLEDIQNTVLNSGIRADFIDIISYDAISEYYCNKLYVYFNTLERNLRKLFFNIYVLNFGAQYYGETIDKSLRDGLKSVIKQDTRMLKTQYKREYACRNNDDFDEIITIQRLFYSFDYTDMKNFLFTPVWSNYDKDVILKRYEDLSLLSDEELREIIKCIEPQNNWNRFFSKKVDIDDIEQVIDNIREYRNTVAHFKFFTKDDYRHCLKEVSKLNKAVLKAIKVTEDEDFDKKNMEHIRKMWAPTFEKFANVMNGIAQRVNESLNRFVISDAFTNFQKAISKLGEVAINYNIEETNDSKEKSEY